MGMRAAYTLRSLGGNTSPSPRPVRCSVMWRTLFNQEEVLFPRADSILASMIRNETSYRSSTWDAKARFRPQMLLAKSSLKAREEHSTTKNKNCAVGVSLSSKTRQATTHASEVATAVTPAGRRPWQASSGGCTGKKKNKKTSSSHMLQPRQTIRVAMLYHSIE